MLRLETFLVYQIPLELNVLQICFKLSYSLFFALFVNIDQKLKICAQLQVFEYKIITSNFDQGVTWNFARQQKTLRSKSPPYLMQIALLTIFLGTLKYLSETEDFRATAGFWIKIGNL